MKLKHALPATALAFALATGFAANSAYADVPKAVANVAVMDTNKDGKISKQEYLAFMGKAFDESAGAKGYCTFEEVNKGFRNLQERYGWGGYGA